jgi:RNA polymerase sigma factor (sigma-70 family)
MAEIDQRSRFEEATLRHLDAAYNLARWLTRDASDAEDVVQESYLRAYKFFDRFRGGDSRSWILKIVRNTCYTWLEKNRPSEIAGELDEEQHEAESGNPETLLVENADREMLKRLLEEIPAEFREVIVMRDIQGLSYKEISAVTDLPLGTVMSRLARGRKRLKATAMAYATGGAI